MPKKNLSEVECAGKRTLVRVDFNVPIEGGEITDDTRIKAALPTIKHLMAADAHVTLCSHLGRPKGKVVPELSLAPVAHHLARLLGASEEEIKRGKSPVTMFEDCVGWEWMDVGQVLMLENTRFHPEEKENDPAFAEALAGGAELYVDDAFGSMHRAHASTVGVTDYVPVCVTGFLVRKELEKLATAREASGEGFVVIMGGAKVEDKIDAIKLLLPRAEKMLIGGAMSWAFFKAKGMEIGESLCKDESLEAARDILATMKQADLDRLYLPEDVHMKQVEPDTGEIKFAPADGIEPGWNALDIGPQTQQAYAEGVADAKIVFWNGPMGLFEQPPFDEGTRSLAHALADTDAYTVVGGGDSAAAMSQLGFEDKVSHVSTGGGASIEFVSGMELPGVDALDES